MTFVYNRLQINRKLPYLYSNNLKSISNSGTSTESTYTSTFCLGHGAASVGFDGWIDQLRLFDKPLNAEQVQELFDEQPY